MINVNWSVFVQIINFLFLIWALNLILYKPIRQILARRREKIAGMEESIEGANSDAEQRGEAFKAGVKEARVKGLTEKEALVQSAADEEKKIIEEINKKSQANLAEIKEKIAKDTAEVKASLQQEIDAFAEAIGQKILGRVV
ncbi:MAG: ATP synthase F0 subunit B [Deltaproteobacteria bacterium]|nr:ATP synthase F0 subunit B [Deltaproteobacteria bacterium]MBW2217931.1 ATP synthase F0 subunit B [Deltaproteobacteria bacterium]